MNTKWNKNKKSGYLVFVLTISLLFGSQSFNNRLFAKDMRLSSNPVSVSGTYEGSINWTITGTDDSYPDCTLTVTGTGNIPESYANAPWYEHRDKVKKLVISDGITGIGYNNFDQFKNLEEAVIGNDVETIGEHAFSNCYNLKKITLPNSLEKIGPMAFMSCESLSSVVIPDSVTEIGNYAFLACLDLREIKLGNGINTIGNGTFSYCTSLVYIRIPSGVTEIGEKAFESCRSLKAVWIPDTVNKISSSAFKCYTLDDTLKPICLNGVYYEGNRADWTGINIENENGSLTGAEIHYNSSLSGEAAPDSVILDEKAYTLEKGSFMQLRANVFPLYAERRNVSWSSDNEAVASVDRDGKVTARSEGNANITAKTENGKKAVCSVSVVLSAADESLDLGNNVDDQTYQMIYHADCVASYLCSCDKGYMLLRYTAWQTNGEIIAAYYDRSFNLLSKRKIPDELPLWGGFYASDDAYYIVTGQVNDKESDRVECFRVTKYDHDWNRLGSAPLYDCNTYAPFDAGSCRMALSGNHLLIRSCHIQYETTDLLHHQTNVTLLCDTENMEICDSMMEVDNGNIRYVSHSFNQFVLLDDGVVTLDHGDGSPRAAVLAKSWQDISDGRLKKNGGASVFTGVNHDIRSEFINILRFPGPGGENSTGAAISGLASGENRYIIAGCSVVQDENNLKRKTRNVFVASADRELSGSDINWLTSFNEGENGATEPQLVYIGNDRFLVLWQIRSSFYSNAEEKIVYYTLVNSHGRQVSDIYSHAGELSDCAPVVLDNEARWFTVNDGNTTFYSISTEDVTVFNTVNFIDDGYTILPEEYRNALRLAESGAMLNETKEVSGRTVSVNYTGYMVYDRRSKIEKEGCSKKKVKNSKSKVSSVSVNILVDGITVPPELIGLSFKNNKKASYSYDKKPPYFDISIKYSPENGIDKQFASDVKKAFKGKKSLRFNIIPVSLKEADTSEMPSKTKLKGERLVKANGLKYLFDYGDAGVKTQKLKYDKNGKSRSKDYTALYDPEARKLTVSGQNNYIGQRKVDLSEKSKKGQ